MNETQSVSLIIPDKYGISKENSNVIAKNCIPIIQEFNKLEIEFDVIMGEKEMTADLAKSSKSLRNKYVKVRTGGVKVIQLSKEGAKKQVDAHDQLNRDFKEEITGREDKLREKELYFEKIEADRLQKIRVQRIAELEKYEAVYGAGDIATMDDELYKHYLNGVKADYEEKKEAERKSEEERIEAEKIEKLHWKRSDELRPYYDYFEDIKVQNLGQISQTDFDKILSELKGKKVKHEKEQEKTRLENEQLKKEAEAKIIADEKAAKERQRLRDKIERERQDKAEAERKQREKSDARKQAEYEAKVKKEREARERIQKELKDKIDADAKAKAAKIKEEADKATADKAEAERLRLLELAPDKEKLTKWIDEMKIGIETKNMSQASEYIVFDIYKKYDLFKKWAKSEVEKIK